MLKRARAVGAALFVTSLLGVPAVAQTVQVDEALPEYKRAQGVAGKIKSIGSDTLNNVMGHWAETFKKFYPSVAIEVEGKGSSTAPPALIEGQAQFGPMSREMKASEIDAFEEKFGYKPTLLRTGIDTLAVFVHKDNPLDEITMEQIQQVFSVAGPEMTWGDLGVEEPRWASRPVSLYGRNSASGTYGFFKQVALGGSDFKVSVKEQPGSSSVVQGIARDPAGIGYSGIGYDTADVKPLKIAEYEGDEAFDATYENAISGDYLLARFLYVYINKDPRQALDPLRAEFIRLVFSRQGQEDVIKGGYFPVGADIAREELTKLGLEPGF